MPYFSTYVPDAQDEKGVLFYDLWGRTTLTYSTSCSKSKTDAVNQLNKMSVRDVSGAESLNKAVWITAVSFAGTQLIWLIIQTLCYCKRDCRKHKYYKVNEVLYSGFFLAMSITLFTMVSINFARLMAKYNSLKGWADYSSCVD